MICLPAWALYLPCLSTILLISCSSPPQYHRPCIFPLSPSPPDPFSFGIMQVGHLRRRQGQRGSHRHLHHTDLPGSCLRDHPRRSATAQQHRLLHRGRGQYLWPVRCWLFSGAFFPQHCFSFSRRTLMYFFSALFQLRLPRITTVGDVTPTALI